MITSFRGKYRFLSNLWMHPVRLQDDLQIYPSVEHAYQAAKTYDISDRVKIQSLRTPGQAKRMGRMILIREDWDEAKLIVMNQLVQEKFKDPVLARQLLDTGNQVLVEGNYWNDRFWGQCPVGTGCNHLGVILMAARTEIAYDKTRKTSSSS